MKFLFLHPNFPAQFRDLAATLARDPQNEVVFGTMATEGSLPGVRKVLFKPKRAPHRGTHQYLRGLEAAVLQGQAAARLGGALLKSGFVPDVIYGHSGWGSTLFMKDVFPRAVLVGYFEWFYHAHGSDCDFDPAEPLTIDDEARIRMKNAAILTDLCACDAGSCPTHWQHRQFPTQFQPKLHVCHDGIDTDYFRPAPDARLVLPRIGLDLSGAKEIVTYVARGMEPYRGFPQFIEAMATVLAERPECHVVIVGDDRVAYGKPLPKGASYKQRMLEKFPLDPARTHFTGLLPYREYLAVLQASSVHVYLTRPFVLSWSLMEAMSAGCLVVASDTAPVREVMEDGRTGLLTDFFSPGKIAARIGEALEGDFRALRRQARAAIEQRFRLRDLLPKRIDWLRHLGGERVRPALPIPARAGARRAKQVVHRNVEPLEPRISSAAPM